MNVPATPRATLRLQFHKGFTLDDAEALVPYMADLGISHLYASPILRARAGSTHGYDVADPTVINPEIGGEAALRRLVASLREKDLGLILDIVPNHMGTGPENPWWQNMLQWGEESSYANFFDVDWRSADPALTGRILLPVLGEQYGDVLARGDLKLTYDEARAAFMVAYYDTPFPIRLADHLAILRVGGIEAIDLISALGSSAAAEPGSEAALREGLRTYAATQEGRAVIDAALATFNGPDHGPLHELLERQNHRLAWWRTANDEINWRRFFDVNELAGLRAEREEVFETTHALLLRFYAEGLIDGFRIDHVDGLADPGCYCRRLRERMTQLSALRPEGLRDLPPYISVEKILAHGEKLREDWQVEGTSGYDFMDQVSAVLHDGDGAQALDALWTEVTGGSADFADYEYPARLQMIGESFTSELERMSQSLQAIARASLSERDTSLASLRRTLTELLAHFPVYRTYADANGRSGDDQAVMQRALDAAAPYLRPGEEPLLPLLDGWLGGDAPSRHPGEDCTRRLRAIQRFQQLTSPVAAKSVEDTAFYRYGRLISRNEVGSDPAILAIGADEFHERCSERFAHFPAAMLATATHDHKRGEDARARIAVLSELPGEWSEALRGFRRMNAPFRAPAGGAGAAPDPIDETMLYQTLLGAWPMEMRADDAPALAKLFERVAQWQFKALREAKRRTRWSAQDEAYEAACRRFLEQLLTGPQGFAFRQEFQRFVDRVAPAGALNGLSQTMLRLTTPGIPDLYQGTEYWDLSLVDPDNRSPVDFRARKASLAEAGDVPALLPYWRDGRIKQALVARILAFRRENPMLFAHGTYEPLQLEGPFAQHAVAFERRFGQQSAIVVATRLAAHLALDTPLATPRDWWNTKLRLHQDSGTLVDVVSGRAVSVQDGGIHLAEALAVAPVCLLTI